MTIAIVDAGFPFGTNMDLFDAGLLPAGSVTATSDISYTVNLGEERLIFAGVGFTYGPTGLPTGGTITAIEDQYQARVVFDLRGLTVPVSSFLTWAATHDTETAKTVIFGGTDTVTGGPLDDLLRAFGGADSISGGAGDDTLDGGVDNDTIDGGAGKDVLIGGAGADVFNIGLRQSAVTAADRIADWTASDFLSFANHPIGTSDYAEASAADYAAATTLANGLIASGAANLVVVAVGADLAVFADSAADNGAADDAVILTGHGLADVSASNFTVIPVTPPATPAPATPTTPVTPPGSAGNVTPSTSATTGNDSITARAGATEVHAGAGNDTIAGASTADYLRGDDGNDVIDGGAVFDDINGNAGDDTAHGNAGDDWVVGGKDNDWLYGDAGGDIVWGNLGNDRLDGGDGDDQVRGGQGDDVLFGGGGNDFVSGDRGNDTITGGFGADIFHGSQDAGIDRVLDFSYLQGDRVMLDPGTTYTVGQVGSDTVIDMGGGHQMILVGVQLPTLPTGWIL